MHRKNFLKIFSVTFVLGVVAAGIFLIGIYIGYENRPAFQKVTGIINKEAVVPTNADFDPFWEAWNIINEKFPNAQQISDQDRVYGAISGLVGSLNDPYSVFFNPEQNKQFSEEISGSFSGIGVEIGQKDGILTVIAPLKGSPAAAAGIQAGDQIYKIGKQFTADISIDEAIKNIRGEAGTPVELTIVRPGLTEPKTYTIKRQKINIPTVDTERREADKVFVIHLYNFSAQSPTLFAKALQEFADSGYTRLVLDLRNNPGGYLEAAVSMANWFLPKNDIVVKEIGKESTDVTYHRSSGPGIFKGKIKMVVLVNQGSASASEILAGALHEHGIATLMGEKTYGKGSVQELVPLTKDTSIKITVAKWYTPKGVSISDQGLVPEIVVTQKPPTEKEKDIDEQLEAAITHLKK